MMNAAYRGELDVLWTVGGNFLETLPEPSAVVHALGSVATRIHQDIVLSSAMLVEPKETVVLFPAATRYESPGGGCETTTERRIIFCPEIPGRRIGSAKPEWEVFGELAARVRPERAMAVRRRSSPAGAFYVSTRRGKQFNSMVQRDVDPLTGAARGHILMSSEDAVRLGVQEGQRIRLRSSTGAYTGVARIDEIKPGNLEVYWPEANMLLSSEDIDRDSQEPDYNAVVTVEQI
jgi:predicted molibdopterin-dependent oxidoreductase YjgC